MPPPVLVKYPVFALFIGNIQKVLSPENKLGVHHLTALVKIRERIELNERDMEVIPKLLEVGAIKQNKEEVWLSGEYTRLVEILEGSDIDKILAFVSENAPIKMREILQLFSHRLTRRQVNNMVFKLVEEEKLIAKGRGPNRTYSDK